MRAGLLDVVAAIAEFFAFSVAVAIARLGPRVVVVVAAAVALFALVAVIVIVLVFVLKNALVFARFGHVGVAAHAFMML